MADNKFAQSIETLILGMTIGVIAFLMLGYTEGLFYDKNVVRWLPELQEEELVRTDNGMMKLSGVPEVKTELKIPDYEKNQVFIKRIIEEKIEDEWVETRTDELWANFTLNGIEVIPENSTQYFNLEQKYVKETNIERQTMYGIDAQAPIIVVGSAVDGLIRDGNIFAISNLNNAELEKELKSLIHFDWWLYKLIAWFLLSVGLVAFLLPLLAFVEILPELGLWGILAFVGACIGFGFILVAIETLVFAYWFLIFLILGFMLYLFIRINIKKKKKPINILPN